MLSFAKQFIRCTRQRWLKLHFNAVAKLSLGSLSLAHDLQLHVPVRVSGGRGTLHIGNGVSLGYPKAPKLGDGSLLLQPRTANATIEVGDRTMISNNAAFIAMCSIRIGSDCLIGDLVAVYDCDFHELDPRRRTTGYGRVSPVVIGNNVWIGSRAVVLRGAAIGDNSVIAAGSVVTKSIPANCIAAGVPARVVRTL